MAVAATPGLFRLTLLTVSPLSRPVVVNSVPAYAGNNSVLSIQALMDDGQTLIDEFSIVGRHGDGGVGPYAKR